MSTSSNDKEWNIKLQFFLKCSSKTFRSASNAAAATADPVAPLHHADEADQDRAGLFNLHTSAPGNLVHVDAASAGNPRDDETPPAASIIFAAVVNVFSLATAGQTRQTCFTDDDDAGFANSPGSTPDAHKGGNGSCSRPSGAVQILAADFRTSGQLSNYSANSAFASG